MPRFEPRVGNWYFEIERDGRVVRTCAGSAERKRIREKTHDTEDDARYAYGRAIANQRLAGYAPAGPSRQLAAPSEPTGSALLVDEHFAAGDDGFLSEVLRASAGGKLAALAERWYADARPWARRMLLAYIDDGCDRPEHKGLVKRLFKRAEAAGDDEAMAHFMVAFDGLGPRLLVRRHRSSPPTLRADPAIPERLARDGKPFATDPRFSRTTRRYLARRAYRYFRRIAHHDVARYGRGMRAALPLYRDEALATPARLLDAWGLMHALYCHAPELGRADRALYLVPGASLGTLAPAPQFPEAWRGVFDELLAMLQAAGSRTVRAWTIRWLQAHHAAELAALPFARVKPLVTAASAELQQLGVQLLGALPGLETLPIAEWLELLAIDNLELLPALCELVARHVTPARLTLEQCIALACAPAAPVARLGLAWARGKRVETAGDLRTISRLASAGVASVRDAGAAWAAQTVAAHAEAMPEHLRELCDAPHADARSHALEAVVARPELAPLALWLALTESPYDDVRAVVIEHARRWRDEAHEATLRRVWSSALLAVHRGSRVKPGVARAVAERIASHPGEAGALLPILGLALRSVRPAERLAAVAAVARAVYASPELRALAHQLMPELVVADQVAS